MNKFWLAAAIIAAVGWSLHSKEASSSPQTAYIASEQNTQDSETNPATGPKTFGGYDCTEDCSGHQAGYDWAEAHDIDDEGTCDSLDTNSESFKEGCKAFVNGDEQNDDDSDSTESGGNDRVTKSANSDASNDPDDNDNDDAASSPD